MQSREDKMTDADLVSMTLRGDREAFTPLLLRHFPSVLRLCGRLLGSASEAQDVAQEAALQAFLGLGRLREPERFGAWLHAIAANLARMALRRRTNHLRPILDAEIGSPLWAQPLVSPEDAHAARELHDTILAALRALSAVNREAVIGYYLEGYSYTELADLLGVPLSTVKGRLFKGRRQLQRSLAPAAEEVLSTTGMRKEAEMQAETPVHVQIEGILERQKNGEPIRVVLLHDAGANRTLPIWIGPFEANSIELAMQGESPARPMTHDLTLRLLESLGGEVDAVTINKLVDTTFYAEITLTQGGRQHTVDARPSDGMALAVRTGVPVQVMPEVLETAGIDLSKQSLVEALDEEEARWGCREPRSEASTAPSHDTSVDT